MAQYRTPAQTTHATIYEKKSEFIAYISHAASEEERAEFLSSIRKKHHDARHHCFAYTIKNEKIERQSDDGEPQKTAGMPILEVLRHSGLEDTIIVVVRYFGGTLLGTGGLVRAYTRAAQRAVAGADILTYEMCVDIKMEIEYSLYDRLSVLLKNHNAKVVSSDFTDKVSLTARMISGTQHRLLEEITLLAKGMTPHVSDEFFDIF